MCCVLASFTVLNPNSHFYYINFIWCFSFLFLSKRFLSLFEEEKHYGIGIVKMEINLFLVILHFDIQEILKEMKMYETRRFYPLEKYFAFLQNK